MAKKASDTFAAIGATIMASIFMIILGLAYFVIMLWIVKTGSGMLDYAIEGSSAVLATSIIVASIMIGSAVQK